MRIFALGYRFGKSLKCQKPPDTCCMNTGSHTCTIHSHLQRESHPQTLCPAESFYTNDSGNMCATVAAFHNSIHRTHTGRTHLEIGGRMSGH